MMVEVYDGLIRNFAYRELKDMVNLKGYLRIRVSTTSTQGRKEL